MTRRAVTSFILLAAVSSSGAACARLETRTPTVASETKAPAFELTSHTGERVRLDTLLAKGPAVVVFYRGWW